jgi:hypothetical protein
VLVFDISDEFVISGTNKINFSVHTSEKAMPLDLNGYHSPHTNPPPKNSHLIYQKDVGDEFLVGNASHGYYQPPFGGVRHPFPSNPHPPAHPPGFPDRGMKGRDRFLMESLPPFQDKFFQMRPNFQDKHVRIMPPHSYQHQKPPMFNGDGGLIPPQFEPNHENLNRGGGRKLCAFFNSPKGCRNGVNCTFLHEGEVKLTKKRDRMMFDK